MTFNFPRHFSYMIYKIQYFVNMYAQKFSNRSFINYCIVIREMYKSENCSDNNTIIVILISTNQRIVEISVWETLISEKFTFLL